MYKDYEIEACALARANEDRAHRLVDWLCQKCKEAVTTQVSDKRTSMQCKCRRWMQWTYRPFTPDTIEVGLDNLL